MLNQLKVARGPRLCKQSSEGSLIVLIRKAPSKQTAARIWSSQNGQIISYSGFACLTLGRMLSAFNETLALQWSATKWSSQMAEASQHCHRPCLSALMYQFCSGGFRAITNPTGTTIWMAAGSDCLKQKEVGSVGWLQKETDAQTPPPLVNRFSRSTSCCHSLPDEPLAGALVLVKQGVSAKATIHHPTPTGMALHHPWNFHVDRPLFF